MGSGSTMTCVLAHNGLDFLRLIAIGYDEICWDENFGMPPTSEVSDFIVHPNVEFQQWIKDMFKNDYSSNSACTSHACAYG